MVQRGGRTETRTRKHQEKLKIHECKAVTNDDLEGESTGGAESQRKQEQSEQAAMIKIHLHVAPDGDFLKQLIYEISAMGLDREQAAETMLMEEVTRENKGEYLTKLQETKQKQRVTKVKMLGPPTNRESNC